MSSTGRVESIHIYPVKAGKGIAPAAARVEPWGLAGDRRWMIVDADGRFLSQRTHGRLALLTVLPDEHGLTLSVPDAEPLRVPTPTARPVIRATVWRSTVAVTAAGEHADAWLTEFLDQPVRLVYLDDPTRRAVDPRYGTADDRVGFADSFPVLLTSTASLAAVNGWLAELDHPAVPMNRFRPNLVVSGFPAWVEHDWRRIRVGALTFRSVKPCGRCVVTTIDQDTAERGTQPLRVLAERRLVGREALFGQNLIPDGSGAVAIGDSVEVLD
jgi:uncharacterized protein YcbX